jgi:hypothetical protein
MSKCNLHIIEHWSERSAFRIPAHEVEVEIQRLTFDEKASVETQEGDTFDALAAEQADGNNDVPDPAPAAAYDLPLSTSYK